MSLGLPLDLRANPTYLNPSIDARYRITIRATDDTQSYTLVLPKHNDLGFMYKLSNPQYATTWQFSPSSGAYTDDTFRIMSHLHPTARIAFDASLIAPATTRTITMPNANVFLQTIVDLSGITPGEVAQLENIDATVLPPAAWGRLSASNQALGTTSNPTFASLAEQGTLILTDLEVGTIDPQSRSQMWYHGTLDADPANAAASYANMGSTMRVGASAAQLDAINVIAEGISSFANSSAGGPMTTTAFSAITITSQLATLVDSAETFFQLSPFGIQWAPPGAPPTSGIALGPTQLIAPTLTADTEVQLSAAPAPAPACVISANPASTYNVPLPVLAPTRASRHITNGAAVSFWQPITSTAETASTQALIDLYQWPATYIITGGGDALRIAIETMGGGTAGAPNVYVVNDALTYTGGINLTGVSHIVVRGAANAPRPKFEVSAVNRAAFIIDYTDISPADESTDITIGNFDIDVTGTGGMLGSRYGILVRRQATALITSTVGTLAVSNVDIYNTDFITPATDRGGVVVTDERAADTTWVTQLRMEKVVFRNLTAQTASGALMLAGVQSYEGMRNAFLWPDVPSIAQKSYWIRGSSVLEQYTYFSRGLAPTTSSFVEISQDGLVSSWDTVAIITFDNCTFSNAPGNAIALSHAPTSGFLAPIALNVSSCTFMNIGTSAIMLTSDSVAHGNLVSLNVINNTFTSCTCGITKDATYVSGFATLNIARNTYKSCVSTDSGFAAPSPQAALAPDMQVCATMSKYRDLIDYGTWAPATTDYFTTTSTYASGAWYTLTFSDGLPSGGWDIVRANNASCSALTGQIVVGEDGTYQIAHDLAATISNVAAAAAVMLESYVAIDAEAPPAAAPLNDDQRYKIMAMPQQAGAGADAALTTYSNRLMMALRKGQTIRLAVRWVVGPAGPQQFCVQHAHLDVRKIM